MARRNLINMDFRVMNDLVTRLDELGGNIKEAVTTALENVADEIRAETEISIRKEYLPAKGKFQGSEKDTEKSIVSDNTVMWHGPFAEVGVGFDYGKKGAGSYLMKGYYQEFHGSPRRMKRDERLHDMYLGRKFMQDMQTELKLAINDFIEEIMEGKG